MPNLGNFSSKLSPIQVEIERDERHFKFQMAQFPWAEKQREEEGKKCLKKNKSKMQRNKSKILGINTNVALIDPAFLSPATLFFPKDKKPFLAKTFSPISWGRNTFN